MSHQDDGAATSRMRQAVIAFQRAQVALLRTHREIKTRPPADLEAFWNGKGGRLEAEVETAARELVAAFEAFSSAGLVAGATDRHQVTEAKRYLKEGAG
ncbi:hypothetical protein ACFQX4_26785 [Roseomonas sp. GCM10028921]